VSKRRGLLTMLLLFLLGFLLGRTKARDMSSDYRSWPGDTEAPTPLEPPTSPEVPTTPDPPATPAPPRYATFIRRNAVAELAAAIGIPIAVVTLLVTAIAARDTAAQLKSSNSQLRLAERQARPILRLRGYPTKPANEQRSGFDRLALEVEGPAEDVEARVLTAIVLSETRGVAAVAISNWWNPTGPTQGEIARWVSKPQLLAQVNNETSGENTVMLSVVEVNYIDINGATQHAYFSLVENLAGYWNSAPYGLHRMDDDSRTRRCIDWLGLDLAIRNIGRWYHGGWAPRVNRAVERRLAAGAPLTVADIEKSSNTISSGSGDFPESCFPA
jgi:hypothetical protein